MARPARQSMAAPIGRFVRGSGHHLTRSIAAALKIKLHVSGIAYRGPEAILKATGDPMTALRPLVLACILAVPLGAHATDATVTDEMFVTSDQVDLNQFKWKKRPLVVFADTADDPAFAEQMELLRALPEELERRDVVVITDTDPDARSDLRLKLRPRGFMLVIVGKDGGVKLRKPFPWHVREISRSIDKQPERKREIREMKERARGR
ncbi:DUF4174 domain-containing protein [Sulfitobacter sp. D35]|uniref:DUF4174 domain-containing protein n=1 Tax=Sulfitobacter sp. D35 TaxID=3083252 RepID=UPI00296EE21C|nr:DUF4174 domain-containing protein [Sulfitobacter sp. D35]MDW4499566.1 DUF4174 domain-containing protein [Sulfitobacter sp. D35]